MRCSTCGEDVPVVPMTDPDVVACVRCRATFPFFESRRRAYRLDTSTTTVSLRHHSTRSTGPTPPLITTDDDWDALYEPHETNGPSPTQRRPANAAISEARCAAHDGAFTESSPTHWLQWFVLSAGVALFTCGAILIGWSFNPGRHELWNVGAPLALLGQVAFLVGLILQLDVLWRHQDWAARRVNELPPFQPEPLTRPRNNVALASSEVNGEPKAASIQDPQLVFREWRGELDRVATQLSRRN